MSNSSVELSSYRDQHFKVFRNDFHVFPIRLVNVNSWLAGLTNWSGKTSEDLRYPLYWKFILLHNRRTNSWIVFALWRYSANSDGIGQVQEDTVRVLLPRVLQSNGCRKCNEVRIENNCWLLWLLCENLLYMSQLTFFKAYFGVYVKIVWRFITQFPEIPSFGAAVLCRQIFEKILSSAKMHLPLLLYPKYVSKIWS